MPRESIPAKPNMPSDFWSIAKNFVTKDISKVSIPVNFCEPLTMLQRIVENFEYYWVLDNAAKIEDPFEQLCHVAGFTVSPYCRTLERVGKPFNPLLGETYEFDQTKILGWRAIAEQVSHHPPRSALFVEGDKWRCWEDYGVTLSYRGNYVLAKPEGITHLIFDSGNHYTWKKVMTKLNNLVFGSLWVDNNGTSEVISHTHELKCLLTYSPSSSKEALKKVRGTVKNVHGEKSWVIQGEWDRGIRMAPIDKNASSKVSISHDHPTSTIVWQKSDLPKGSAVRYFFSSFTTMLNEPVPGVAPTDSRNRVDVRSLEEGKWEEANNVKIELEEGQRTRLKSFDGEPEPTWFIKENDEEAGTDIFVYKGKYWECKKNKDWRKCPTIF